MLERVRGLWAVDPVRAATAVAAVVVFVCAKRGLIVEQQDVITALLLVVPVVLGGDQVARRVEPPILASDLTGRATELADDHSDVDAYHKFGQPGVRLIEEGNKT